MQSQLDSRFSSLVLFIKKSSESSIPEEVQGYLFRFGSVLICGNIEQSIKIIILNRLAYKAQPQVLNFVKSHLLRGANFDCSAIEQLLNRFDTKWYRSFCQFVENNPDVKEGVSSCYAVRNSVAHGGSMNLGSQRLEELAEVSRGLIDGVVQSTK